MKLTLIILASTISALLVVGCSPQEVIEMHGIITENNKAEIVIINPEKFDSYNKFVDRIEQVVCNDSIPTLSVKVDNVNKLLGLANPCLEGVSCILIERRNVLRIQDERIDMNSPVELDSLEEYIYKHYTNVGNSYQFSENPSKAKISISYGDLPITGLNSLLSKILISFETFELQVPLVLTLDRIIPPPPPPPPNDKYETDKENKYMLQ